MNQWRKGIASWRCGKTLYLSVPFTWDLSEAEAMARKYKGPVVAGGPAVSLRRETIDWAETPESCPFDTLAMHNPCATFTTRGCPNRCAFCAVPKIEGEFRELPTLKPAPMVCDNNILASSVKHFERVIDSLREFPYVDFNQGLDCHLFRKKAGHRDMLRNLRGAKLRFAFDNWAQESDCHWAVTWALERHFKAGVYVLIGFDDTPEDARARLELVRGWGALPNPMRYQPLDATEKNAYVAPGWTDRELRRMSRYYSRLSWLGHVPYEDYVHDESDKPMPLFDERSKPCLRNCFLGK